MLGMPISQFLDQSSSKQAVTLDKTLSNKECLVLADGKFVGSAYNRRLSLTVTVGRVSTARLLGMCGNHG
jgi:hypothetical protein